MTPPIIPDSERQSRLREAARNSLCILHNRALDCPWLSRPASKVINDVILSQYRKGVAKYGVSLTDETPGDMLAHAIEEAVDLVAYLTSHEPRVVGFWRRMKVRRARRVATWLLRYLAELMADRNEKGAA